MSIRHQRMHPLMAIARNRGVSGAEYQNQATALPSISEAKSASLM